jgi:putative SOS response-associated peptidase YedK
MCNLYSITTNQEAITRLFRKVNRYVGNPAPMPGVFPNYPAPVIRRRRRISSSSSDAVRGCFSMPDVLNLVSCGAPPPVCGLMLRR